MTAIAQAVTPEIANALMAFLTQAATPQPTVPPLGHVPGATPAENAAFAAKIAESAAEQKKILLGAAKKMAREMYDALSDIPISVAIYELRAIGDTMRWRHFGTKERLDYLDREMFKLEQQGVDPNGVCHAEHLIEDAGSVTVDQSTTIYRKHANEAEHGAEDLQWTQLRMMACDIALVWANDDFTNVYGVSQNGFTVTFDSDISEAAYRRWLAAKTARKLENNAKVRETTPSANRALRATGVASSITDFMAKTA